MVEHVNFSIFSTRKQRFYWFNHQFAAVDQLNCLESKHELYFKTCEAQCHNAFFERVTIDQHQNNWITYDDILTKTYQLLSNVDWVRHDIQQKKASCFC